MRAFPAKTRRKSGFWRWKRRNGRILCIIRRSADSAPKIFACHASWL